MLTLMSSPSRTTDPPTALKKRERTRRQLIAAAVDEIASNGDGFTILDVTRRAEVSNGTFYNHFDDRDALIDAVVADVLDAFVRASAAIVTLEDPVRRFAGITAALLAHAASHPKLATVLLRVESLPQTDSWPIDPFSHLRNDLAEAATQGRTAKEPTDATLDVVTGALTRTVLRITRSATDLDYQREVIGLILETLGLDHAEAREIAREAVDAAPDLEPAYQAADPLLRIDTADRPAG